MAGRADHELRIEIDQAAYERLTDFGEVRIKHPGKFDAIRLTYRDEDLERDADEFE